VLAALPAWIPEDHFCTGDILRAAGFRMSAGEKACRVGNKHPGIGTRQRAPTGL
jgi:hypothetical protein